MPALRWDGAGYRPEGEDVDHLLRADVPGFILFGGTAEAAAALTADLRLRAGRPLLIAADLERGAGQQFEGLPALPPMAAISTLGDPAAFEEAGRMTARGARAVGVDLVFAPVLDLDVEPDNPIVGTRSPGGGASAIARAGRAWIRGCLDAGVACCAKHWPGHGRATADSHAVLPVVGASVAELAADREPFDAAIAEGVPVVMTAHVAFPALDPSGAPATTSAATLAPLRAAFDGVVVTDALIMEGAGAPGEVEVAALAAGVDLLLYPHDPLAAIDALGRALSEGRLDPARLDSATARIDRLVDRFARAAGPPPSAGDHGRAEAFVDRVVAAAESRAASIAPVTWTGSGRPTVHLVTVDDDRGGPYPPPSRAPFSTALREAGVEVVEESAPEAGLDPHSGHPDPTERNGDVPVYLLAVYAEPRAWKGRAGLSARALQAIESQVARRRDPLERCLLLTFGGERIARDVASVLQRLSIEVEHWVVGGGEAVMQRAAARRVAGRLVASTGAPDRA